MHAALEAQEAIYLEDKKENACYPTPHQCSAGAAHDPHHLRIISFLHLLWILTWNLICIIIIIATISLVLLLLLLRL
jgi:hypothetical protein